MRRSITDIKTGKIIFFFIAAICMSFRIILTNWLPIDKKEAAQELLELNKKISEMKSYSFHITYKSYEGHYQNAVHEVMEGFLYRSGNNVFSCLNKIYTIQDKKLRVVIDSGKKTVKVTRPLETKELNVDLDDYIRSMEICESIKKSTSGEITAYRIEHKAKRGVVAQEIYCDKNFFRQSNLYYANDITLRVNNDFKKETVYPRLEMYFSDFRNLKKADESKFDTEKYVTIKNNKLILGGSYKNFKLIDGRFQ